MPVSFGIRLHEIEPARRYVAGIERNVLKTEHMLRPIAPPGTPHAEETLYTALGHVLDGDVDTSFAGLFEWSCRLGRQRPPRRWRVNDNDGSFDPAGQLRHTRKCLTRIKPPSSATKG